jgi:hypothetical protein
VTVPSPCPCPPETIVTQPAWLAAVHAHSRETPIVTVPVPPSGPKDVVELVTAAWQRAPLGAVTLVLVDAELPQAAAATDAATTSWNAKR